MALLKVATSSIPDENTCQSQILETDLEKGIDDTRPTPLKSVRVEQEVVETKLSNEPNLEDNDPSSPLLSASSTLSKKRSSTSQDICRICHCEAEPDAPLVAPCSCSGSLKYVHQACLQRWVQSSDMRNCELCKYPFIMQTKIKPYKEWEKLNMSAMERRKLACSVTFHAVAFTCVIWSLYVLIDRSAEEYSSGQLQWPFWTKLVVVAIGFTGGVVFMYVQCTMYVSLCRRWRAYNRVILVQNAPGGSSQTSGASIVNELAVTPTIVTNTTAAVTTANSTSSNGSLKLGSSGWKKDKKSPVQSVVTPVMATALPANMRSKVNVTPELLVPEDTCTPLAEISTQSILRRSTSCSEVDDGTAVLLSDTNPSTWRAFRASHHEDADDKTAPIPLM